MLQNKIILVSVDSWEANHRFPTGHYVRTLGAVGDKVSHLPFAGRVSTS